MMLYQILALPNHAMLKMNFAKDVLSVPYFKRKRTVKLVGFMGASIHPVLEVPPAGAGQA